MNLNPTIGQIMNMFVDRTPGESTLHNRLTTQETESGNVALIGYGWQKLAEYDEERKLVTVFTGHHDADCSPTTTRWLNRVQTIAQERGRDTFASSETPIVAPPPEDAHQYIKNYIGFRSPRSAVEQNAVDTVINALRGVTA